MLLLMVCFFLVGSVVLFSYVSLGGECLVRDVLSSSFWFDSDYLLYLDVLSMVFSLMLLVCGVVALCYCGHYFAGLVGYWGLFYLMLLFLLVMLFLVFSGSLVLTLILWEYLGFVSFLLILYYSTSGSLRASVVTLVTSRFGDVGLFVVFSWLLNDFSFYGFFFVLCVFLVVSTKSACYPFTWWLLEAMRAPTPVSSLVHSSTLVAAGVWFLLRYSGFACGLSVWLVFMSACFTIILSALGACWEMDMKKLVAFSTCNNISWCLLYMICGDVLLSACQLLVHGLCKALLFMSVGDLMVSSGSSQSGVDFYCLSSVSWLGCIVNIVLISFLCGIPFLGVFFTKHLFIGFCFHVSGVLFVFFLVVGVFLSNVYSIRLALTLLSEGGGLNTGNYSCFFYICGYVVLGFVLDDWLCGFLEEVGFLSWRSSFVVLLVQVLGCVWGLYRFKSVRGFSLFYVLLVSGVFGSGALVDGVYRVHRIVCDVANACLFRWEVWLCEWTMSLEFSRVQLFVGLCATLSWLVLGLGSVFYGVLVVA